MEIISFKDWILKVDREATFTTYASVQNGSAGECDCTECKNYLASRDGLFPAEVKLLLCQLGIDYKKEVEVWRMFKGENGKHRYSGYFHFKGGFEGKDCFITNDGKNGTFSLTAINESFSIGFRFADELTFFKAGEQLVQIEFEVDVPWTVERRVEPEW